MVTPMQALRQIVTGTDFSESADHALAHAIELALAASARVTLVHVCEPDDDGRFEKAEAALSEVVARHQRPGVELTGLLRSGRPWTKLDNVAAEVGASLIVVGRQGAGQSAGLGSVADHLVRAANRPVLTVACNCDSTPLRNTP